jgi:S-adenosylmethionine synthetase
MDLRVGPLQGGVGSWPVEVVERKGLGHPDSICDALAEELSLALSRLYLERGGRILHHNVDKALLWGGAARPAFGGGEVTAPFEIYLAGRASGRDLPVEELVVEGSRRWLRANLRGLDVDRHVRIHSLVRPGSSDLVGLFERAPATPLANDTSIGVGYAPLSELEATVLGVEQWLTSAATRDACPELGEDVKVMGVRREGRIALTLACAFVGRHLAHLDDYLARKAALAEAAVKAAARTSRQPVEVVVNGSDAPEAGSVYLTVTGLSAEAGDDGEAGRGNRANGLIAPARPMTMESVAGKNPVSHVGKLYNIAASLVAEALVEEIDEVLEAECVLVSRIGRPIDDPQVASLRVRCVEPRALDALRARIAGVAEAGIAGVTQLAGELVEGRIRLDRWPLRA